ncbi:MAG: hypothetical protein OXD49_19420 [Candidatus Poribacteria bacterium]|nr:hypothetical protein [Candidatus Poribacteria bacterium]
MLPKNENRLSGRSFLLGTCFVIAICCIVSYAELVITYIQIGFLQLPPAVIGLFFFLVLGNRLLERLNDRFGLSPRELMCIYCMMLVASMISSRGVMEKLIPALIAVNYFTNETNSWDTLFFPHIKPWLIPFSPEQKGQATIAISFYEGIQTGDSIPWRAWVEPLCVWGVLVFLVFTAFLCLAAILRKQWIENEKLTFPLVSLPLEFVHEGRGFLRNRLMWLGFALPALIFTLNGFHEIWPQIPNFPLRYLLNPYFTERPFNAIAYTPIFLSFAAVGFFYLLPTQLLFSLWFFFLFTRFQDIVAAIFGWRVSTMPLYPTRLYIGYQVAGAYIVLVISFIYMGFPHFRRVFRRAFTATKGADAEELLSDRTAVWVLIISLILAIVWCYTAGLNLGFAAFEILVYVCIIAVVMARSTAEGGLLMTETSFRPLDLYQLIANKAALGTQSLTVLSLLDAIFTRDQRGLILTGFLDGLKIRDRVGMSYHSLVGVFVLGSTLAFLCAAVIHLWLPYTHGANYMYSYTYRGNPLWAFQDNVAAMEGLGADLRTTGGLFFGIGALVTTGLVILRMLYWWCPLHPLGYALSASWTLIVFWFPVFIAWGIKTPLLRYSGIRQYQRLRPFFLGMVFGEFSMAVIWTLISWSANTPAPFFPWP